MRFYLCKINITVFILILLDFANLTSTVGTMKMLGDSLKKALAHKHLGNQMVGAVAMNAVRNFLNSQKFIKSKIENQESDFRDFELDGLSAQIEGYVRFNILFLKITDQALKIQIFKQKNQILHEANLAIEKVGYTTKLQEIRMKA